MQTKESSTVVVASGVGGIVGVLLKCRRLKNRLTFGGFRHITSAGCSRRRSSELVGLVRRKAAASATSDAFQEALDTPSVVVEIADAGDTRLALYRVKLHRDHDAYEAQTRDLVASALKEVDREATTEPLKSLDVKGPAPLRRLGGCVTGVHYTFDCLQQLKAAKGEGRLHACLHSALLPEGTRPDLVDACRELFPVTYILKADLFLKEFGQDVPWASELVAHDFESSRSPWRRFENGGLHSSVRFALACPISRELRCLRPPYLVLDGLSSDNNVGQIMRTAYSLGVTSVLVSKASWGCLNGRACRVSMGWLYFMGFHLAEDLPNTLDALKREGVRVYAAENQFSQPVAPHEPHGDQRWALVVGSEGSGISAPVIAACDVRVCVPQRQGQSLNVAHATSICLYELGKFSFD